MPLWKIYCPVDTFTDADKRSVAGALTKLYGRAMPRFYVGVIFQEVAENNFYIGGEPTKRFVRIWADHIARTMDTPEAKKRFFDGVNGIILPLMEERGLDWELHVDETPFDLWKIQGISPPPAGSEDDKRWTVENRPSARTHS